MEYLSEYVHTILKIKEFFMQSILNKISNLEKLIGNTPLIEITFKYKEANSIFRRKKNITKCTTGRKTSKYNCRRNDVF